MMKNVVITINSAQKSDPEGEDSIEFTTDGVYSFDGEQVCLSYYESEVTGMQGTRTSVTVKPEEVTVDRDGMVVSSMTFREGEKTTFQYSTPYGIMTLRFDTRSIEKSFDKDGGELVLDYVVDIEHAVVSHNFFKLTVARQSAW